MTPVHRDRLERHYPALRKAWGIMVRASAAPPDFDWAEALARRQEIDPLADHAWSAGYIVGVADALGIPIPDIVNAIRQKPQRRIVQLKRTG